MTSKQVAILFLLLTLFAGTYAALNYYNINRMSKDKMTNKEASTQKQAISLKAIDQDINQTGDVTLSDTTEGLLVEVNVSGYTTEIPQPVYIHKGGCPSTGEILYPLNPVINGVSKTIVPTLNLSTLKPQLPLSLNVHLSADEIDVATSCGELTL